MVFQHCSSYAFTFVYFPDFDQAEYFRRSPTRVMTHPGRVVSHQSANPSCGLLSGLVYVRDLLQGAPENRRQTQAIQATTLSLGRRTIGGRRHRGPGRRPCKLHKWRAACLSSGTSTKWHSALVRFAVSFHRQTRSVDFRVSYKTWVFTRLPHPKPRHCSSSRLPATSLPPLIVGCERRPITWEGQDVAPASCPQAQKTVTSRHERAGTERSDRRQEHASTMGITRNCGKMGVESSTDTPSTVEIPSSCFSTMGRKFTLVESVCHVELQTMERLSGLDLQFCKGYGHGERNRLRSAEVKISAEGVHNQ